MELPGKSSLVNVDFGQLRPKKPTGNKQFLWFGLAVVAVIVLLTLIYLFLPKQTKDTVSTSKTTTKVATTSAQIKTNTTTCKTDKEYDNEKQGYQVCFPAAWTEKDLQVSSLTAGFDPTGFDNSFPGTINVTISDQPEDVSAQNLENTTDQFTFGKTSVDKTSATQVVYTRLTGDPLAAFPKGIDTILTNFGRTYNISLVSTDDAYAANQKLYQDFLTSFKFIKDTPQPPWSNSRNILLYSPWPGDTVTSPVEVTGQAIAFEALVSIRIKDSSGHVLANTQIQTQSGSEQSPFDSKITFQNPTTKKGTLEIFTISSKDGSEQDKVTVPIEFP